MQVSIQARGFEMTDALAQHVERRLMFALGWARHQVLRVSVRLSDENGPRGGLDKRCSLVLALQGMPELVIEDTRDDLYRAIDCAADRVGRALSRRMQKQRATRRDAPLELQPLV